MSVIPLFSPSSSSSHLYLRTVNQAVLNSPLSIVHIYVPEQNGFFCPSHHTPGAALTHCCNGQGGLSHISNRDRPTGISAVFKRERHCPPRSGKSRDEDPDIASQSNLSAHLFTWVACSGRGASGLGGLGLGLKPGHRHGMVVVPAPPHRTNLAAWFDFAADSYRSVVYLDQVGNPPLALTSSSGRPSPNRVEQLPAVRLWNFRFPPFAPLISASAV